MEDEEPYYVFDEVRIKVEDFPSEGFVLDIGGGGEGIIGRLKGRDVIAIDLSKEELEEAVDGPLKIVMDARDLKFLDGSFQTATAFFSLMYMKTRRDHLQVLKEVARVLKPGGTMHIWEIDLAERPQTDKEIYVVHLRYRVAGKEIETGYGRKWPAEARGEPYYLALAGEAGLTPVSTEWNQNTFHLLLQKKG